MSQEGSTHLHLPASQKLPTSQKLLPPRGPSPLSSLYNASPRATRSLSHSVWNPMPRHGGFYLGHAKCNEQFHFSMNLYASAPLCNIVVVSCFPAISFVLTSFPMRISQAGAEHGVCVLGTSQQHRKTQRIRALTRELSPTFVISPKSSDSWACSHARHLTKDLGAYSPREIPMRKLMSAHELYNCALLVGMPLCPT